MVYRPSMGMRTGTGGGAYGHPQGFGYAVGAQDYLRYQAAAAKQDRQHEINMREMQYMAARQALGLDGRGGPGGPGTGLDQFLGKWNEYLGQAAGVYNKALQSFEGTYDWMTDARESANRLGDLAGEMETEYRGFRQDFAGTEADFRLAAQEELQARGVARGQLMDLTRADYEGAAGRAMADVTQQAEIGRQAEARRLQRLGMDPTTMMGRTAMQRLAGAEATGKAMAATAARRGEKERVTGATAMAMQLLDPTRMAQTAIGIRGAGTELLQSAAGLRQAETGALSGLAGQQADIARGQAAIGSGLARDIAGQYGDVAGLLAGLQYGQQQSAQNWLNQNPFGAFGGGGGGGRIPVAAGYGPGAISSRREAGRVSAMQDWSAANAPGQGTVGPVYRGTPLDAQGNITTMPVPQPPMRTIMPVPQRPQPMGTGVMMS